MGPTDPIALCIYGLRRQAQLEVVTLPYLTEQCDFANRCGPVELRGCHLPVD